jgi:capsular polysaccharide biosynthesis protein
MDASDATAAGRKPVLTLSDLVGILVRRWRQVLAGVAVTMVAVLGYLALVPPTYTATAVVVVRPVVTDPFAYPSGGADRVLNMNAENGIATSAQVIDQVAGVLRRRPEQVRRALQVEVPVGGQVLRFVYSTRSAGEAVRAANAAADSYLRVRTAGYDEQRGAVLRSYDATITAVTTQRNAAQQALPGSASASSIGGSAAIDQVRALNDQLAQLGEQRAKVASVNINPGALTAPARVPVPSSHDAVALYLAAAALGGLLLGGVVAFARESADRRIRSAAHVAETTGLPLLGTVRRGRRKRSSATADTDLRYVALAVTERAGRAPGQPVVVLATRASDGGSGLAAGLAAALAAAGHRVYLGTDAIDDVRARLLAGQRRHLVLPPPSAPGGTRPGGPAVARPVSAAAATAEEQSAEETVAMSLLLDEAPEAPWTGADPPPADDGPAGPDTVRIGAGTVRTGTLDGYPPGHLVLLDAPAAETDERGVRLARTGSALVVVARDRTRAAELARLTDRLHTAGAQAMGVVLIGGGRG